MKFIDVRSGSLGLAIARSKTSWLRQSSSLSPVCPVVDHYQPVSKLSDAEVLELSEMQMDAKRDRRFSRLLDKQQAGKLTNGEESELLALMQNYQDKLLRKAQALREAVRRGLREPLTP